MTTASDQFTAIDGEHFVTVPPENQTHPELIGVRGQLIASGPDAQIRVKFDGHSQEITISAFEVTEWVEGGAAAAETSGGGLNVGIYYGTETGNTQTAAEAIRDQLNGCNVTACADIADCPVSDLTQHDVLILGASTWNIGDIQYNWEEKLDEIEAQDYKGIKVAIFGLGDAAGYPDTFVDGMGILWDRIKNRGAELFGLWPREGYDFDESKGLYDDDHFLGMVLDEDGQSEMSEERLSTWVSQLQQELQVTAS